MALAARRGHNKTAIALANKLARIVWTVWCHCDRLSFTRGGTRGRVTTECLPDEMFSEFR